MARKNFGVTLDEDLVRRLDEIRGLAPRSRVIEVILRDYLENYKEEQ